MSRLYRVLTVSAAVALAVVLLSACGTDLSGEPEIAWEKEIQNVPTQLPTASPDPATTTEAATETAPETAPETTAESTTTESTAESTAESSEPAAGLDLTTADYDLGFNLFLEQCAACHGAVSGEGPGLANMRDAAATRIEGVPPGEYIYQSIVEPGAFVVEGYADSMPAMYASLFSAQEINSLVKFILEFNTESMTGGSESGAESGTESSSATEGETLIVRGSLVMGTQDGDPIPAGLPVELYAVDAQGGLAGVYETTSAEDHSFVFEDVARAPNMMYLIQVSYDDVPQGAQVAPIEGHEKEVAQDVTLYERTTDTSAIEITWTEMLVNYAPIEEFGLEIWLQLQLGNTGDQIVTSEEIAGPNEWYVSTRVELPVGAFGIQPMQSEGSTRYEVVVEDGIPVLKDTWPLRPAQVHTITVAYYLPYETGAVIDQAFGYPVVGGTVLVPNDTVEFASEQFDSLGVWCCRVSHGGIRVTDLDPNEDINPDKDFTLVKSHPLTSSVDADTRLIFELVGRPTRTVDLMSSGGSSSSGDDNTLPLLIGGFGILLIGVAGVMWWTQRGKMAAPPDNWEPPSPHDKESLLKAIATLDDAYDAGLIDDDVYEQRRATLSELLLPLLDEED